MENIENEFTDLLGKIDFGNVEQMAKDCWLFLTNDSLPENATIKRDAFYHEVSAMIESCRRYYAQQRVDEITKAYGEYAKLLNGEINELIGMAYVHGWRSSRVEAGKELREKIQALTASPTDQ